MANEFFPAPFRMPGYLVAVTAPNSGIDEMQDGSWHVIAQVENVGQGEARDKAQRLIPFVLGTGGDLVMYRMDEEPTVVMRRGGGKEAPAVEDIRPYDPALAEKLEARRKRFVREGRQAKPDVRKAWRPDMRSVGAAAASVLAVAGGLFLWLGTAEKPRPTGPVSYQLDLSDRKVNAMRQGAYQVTMEDPSDPRYTITVRHCPQPDGKDMRREVVDRFQTEHFRQGNGYVPEPIFEWCPGLPRLAGP